MTYLYYYFFAHMGELFSCGIGLGVVLYSCFAKRFHFEGDVAVRRKDRRLYEATPKMRLYGIGIGAVCLIYGLYHLVFPTR
jgi:hypothetical protein